MTRRLSGLALAVSALLGLGGVAEMDAQAPAEKPPDGRRGEEVRRRRGGDAPEALGRPVARRLGQVHLHHRRHAEALAAQAADKSIAAGVKYAKQATRFDKLTLPPETARKLKLLKLSLTLAAPVRSVRVARS